MKFNINLQIGTVVLLALALGCARNEDVAMQDAVEQEEVTITASFADSKTRTVLSEDGGTSVYWEAGDEIAVFSGTEGSKFPSTLTEPAAVSTFTGTMPTAGGEKYLALYPYSSDAVSDGESITTTLPAEQTARAGSFAKDLNLSIAESDSYSMSFYNVCGGLCFKLTTEGIKKITIKSNNGESLAGSVKLAFENGIPAVKEIIDGKDTITLTAPDNGTFATGVWYYIVTLPTTLSAGFQMTFRTETTFVIRKYSDSIRLKRRVFGRADGIDDGLTWKSMGNIVFKDNTAKAACVAKFDINKDGEISYEEASAVTDLSGLFDDYKTITSFDELLYFDHITKLPPKLFNNCTSLKSLAIPSSVISLGNACFSGCTSLTSIEIPSSVTSLGENCFYDCTSLRSIEIPSSVTSLGDRCFGGCTSLMSIEIPSSVTSLGYWFFNGCTSLTSIEIPSSVTSLGYWCFSGCTSLTSIEIPSSVTTLGGFCFNNCTSLTSIEIPSSVTSLSDYCFSRCTSLTSIEIPSSVTSLRSYCFKNCASLTSIEIPSSVTLLGEGCFYNCTSLTSIEIPSSVTSFGENCFSYCTSLTSIEIPSSVTSLGNYCFRGCNNLSEMHCLATSVPSGGNQAFDGTKASSGYLYVPEGSVDLYAKASVWKVWKHIQKLQ